MKLVYFDELVEGSVYWSDEVVVDKDEMIAYAQRNDPWPFHVDEEAAKKMPFGGLVASGGYAISLWYRLGHTVYDTPDTRWAFLGGFDWHVSFLKPIRAGDRLRYKTVIASKRPSSKTGRGIVNSVSGLVNQAGEDVFRVEVAWMIATRPSTPL
jgi:acyl dehydratase